MSTLVRGLIVIIDGILLRMDTQDLPKLGDRIREQRKKLGLTQEDLAHKAEIDRSYIGGVERGERNLTLKVLCAICIALECDIAALTKDIPEVPR